MVGNSPPAGDTPCRFTLAVAAPATSKYLTKSVLLCPVTAHHRKRSLSRVPIVTLAMVHRSLLPDGYFPWMCDKICQASLSQALLYTGFEVSNTNNCREFSILAAGLSVCAHQLQHHPPMRPFTVDCRRLCNHFVARSSCGSTCDFCDGLMKFGLWTDITFLTD